MLKKGFGYLKQPFTEKFVLKIVFGFLERGNAIVLGVIAEAEAFYLGKDVPYPVGNLTPVSDFRQSGIITVCLGIDESLQSVIHNGNVFIYQS